MLETEQSFLDEELFFIEDMDFDAVFRDALSDVVSDQELLLSEKVQRIETIFSEAESEIYNEFIDLQLLSMQLEYFCNHNHDLEEALYASEYMRSLHQDKDEKDKKKLKKKSSKDKK